MEPCEQPVFCYEWKIELKFQLLSSDMEYCSLGKRRGKVVKEKLEFHESKHGERKGAWEGRLFG